MLLTSVGILCAGIIAAIITAQGVNQNLDSVTLPVAGRTLNGFMAMVLTCIALIIPLTANLYTPKLVKLYVAHPLIVTMLSLLLLSHIICLSLNFIPIQNILNHVLVSILALIYLLVMLGALPFLYGISRFLRPDYFMPMLTRKGIQSLEQLNNGKKLAQRAEDLFETIDVVTNIALTGINRGDRQMVLLALQSLHAILSEMIGTSRADGLTWRSGQPYYVPGVAREGQEYLIREKTWPEAYVLAQLLKVMEVASKRQHELLAELAAHLVDTAQLAHLLQKNHVVELHIMAFNTLVHDAIEEQDLRKFQNLSYHYRLLIEQFHDDPALINESARHLVHYGKLAGKQNLHFSLETVIYDLGELILCIARQDEACAMDLVRQWAISLWQESIDKGGLLSKVAWRALVRVYWEAKARGQEKLAELIQREHLSDPAVHRAQIERILADNRELHTEFNDRLMRFAYLSDKAAALARSFTREVQQGA